MGDAYYLSARLRALKGRLISPREYGKILALPDLPAISSALRGTPYGRAIDTAGGAAAGVAAMEEGLRRHVSEILAGLLAVSAGGECAEAVRLLLEFWEIRAIKTILRGKSAGLPAEDILSALCPSGLHDEAALREMCRQPDLRAVVHLLVTWREPWGRPLARALKEYRDSRDLALLETALDRFFFEREARRGGPPFRFPRAAGDDDALAAFLALSVDRANLMTALMLGEDRVVPADPRRHFLGGGWIYDESDFVRLAAAPSLQEALGLAAKSLFERPLKDLSASSAELPRLVAVERALDRTLLRSMRRFLRVDPLGPGLLVCVVLGQILEAANLRTIARGRVADLSDAALRELLIIDDP